MKHGLELALALALSACAATPLEPSGDAKSTAPPVVVAMPTSDEPIDPASTASPTPRPALLEGMGPLCAEAAPRPPTATADATCTVPPTPTHGSVDRLLAARYRPSHGQTLHITRHCDGLAPRIDRVALARGSGHGHSLQLFLLERRGQQFVIDGLLFTAQALHGQHLRVASGSAPASTVDALLDRARAALQAELSETRPPGSGLGLSGFGSSRDFHLRMELADATAVREWRFSGYESSEDQSIYVPLEVAAMELASLLDKLAEGAPVGPHERALFAEHFRGELPHMQDEFDWWVKERYVAMAPQLGSREIVRGLVSLLVPGTDRSTVDTRTHAFAALAGITGRDFRVDDRGRARPPSAVIRDYRSLCMDVKSP